MVYEPKAAEPEVKVPFLVKVSISDLNIRKGPGTNYDRVQFSPPGGLYHCGGIGWSRSV